MFDLTLLEAKNMVSFIAIFVAFSWFAVSVTETCGKKQRNILLGVYSVLLGIGYSFGGTDLSSELTIPIALALAGSALVICGKSIFAGIKKA